MSTTPRERLFVALDTPDATHARELARALAPHVGGFKIGLELFTASGPELVAELAARGRVFVDLKLHDIPNTVAGAAAALTRLGAGLLTVHAAGGPAMLRAAVRAAAEAARATGIRPPTVLAVTVLTSLDDAELAVVGLAGPCEAAVLRLAALARDAGTGGVVCSPREAAAVRRAFSAATIVVPGIRPATAVADDQRRTATAAEALRQGADLLVVGRPITRAADPAAAALALVAEIAAGCAGG